MDEVGLNPVRVLGKDTKFNIAEVLKVSALSREIDNSLRKKHLSLFKADKRIREREGLEPDRSSFYILKIIIFLVPNTRIWDQISGVFRNFFGTIYASGVFIIFFGTC